MEQINIQHSLASTGWEWISLLACGMHVNTFEGGGGPSSTVSGKCFSEVWQKVGLGENKPSPRSLSIVPLENQAPWVKYNPHSPWESCIAPTLLQHTADLVSGGDKIHQAPNQSCLGHCSKAC